MCFILSEKTLSVCFLCVQNGKAKMEAKFDHLTSNWRTVVIDYAFHVSFSFHFNFQFFKNRFCPHFLKMGHIHMLDINQFMDSYYGEVWLGYSLILGFLAILD